MKRRFEHASAVFLTLTFLLAPVSASAHTSITNTTPIYKSTIAEMPPELSIEFSGPLMVIGDKVINSIEITQPDGSELPIGRTNVQLNKLSVAIPQGEYLDGTYLISYRVVAEDGHSVSGSYELYLNRPSSTSASPSEHPGHQSFLHLHKNHLIQAGGVGIVILLWWGYRRFRPEEED